MALTVDLTPDSIDFVLYAGDNGDFQIKFIDETSTVINMTGWVWRAQIRKTRASELYTALIVDSTASAQGIIKVLITSAITRSLAESKWNKTSQWDIEGTPPGMTSPLTLLQGTIYCSLDVTR